MDLSKLDTRTACDKPVEIELAHPTSGEGLKCYISVVGKDGSAFRDHVRKNVNAQLHKDAIAKKSSRRPEALTVEAAEADGVALLVVCTTGFREIEYNGEKPFPFTPENATKLYTEQRWIRAQIDEAIGDLTLFFPS